MRHRHLAVLTAAFAIAAVAFVTVTLLSGTAPARAQALEAYTLRERWSGGSGAPTGHIRQPAGLVVDDAGMVHVVDTARALVHVFDGDSYVRTWGSPGTGTGQLAAPQGIARLPDGRFAIADSGNRRIQLFAADGTPQEAWGAVGTPWDLAVTPDGLVLVTDRDGDRVLVLDDQGSRVGSLGSPGADWGQIDQPTGIDVFADGRIALVDGGNQRIQVWDPTGAPLEVLTNTSSLPYLDVAVLDDDTVVVAALRQLFTYELSTRRTRGASRAPVPGGFASVTVAPQAGVITPTLWSTLTYDDLTGLRRLHSAGLTHDPSVDEWLGLPSPAGEMVSPRQIATRDDTVLILDAWPRIQRLRADGRPVDQTEAMLVTDLEPRDGGAFVSGGGAVRSLNLPAGDEPWSWRQVSPTVWIAGLAYDDASDHLFALDVREQGLHVLDGAGAPVRTTPLTGGSGPGYRSYTDIAMRGDGLLTLVNRTTKRVEVRDQNGALIDEWPVHGVPLRAATDGSGRTFVLTREGWVWKLGVDGTVESWWDATLLPGGSAAPTDLAVGPAGQVLVLDGAGNQVLVYDLDPTEPVPTPPAAEGCTFARDKWAAPPRITLGETVGVTLTVAGECLDEGGGADVMLVLDRSGSMAGRKMEAARAAAVTFVGEMDFGVSRVGLVVFNLQATMPMSLTTDAASVVDAIVGFGDATSGTDIGEGIQLAHQELAANGRPGVERIMVVMTDGRPESADVDAEEAATAAKADGVRVFSIGFGTDADPDLMARVASAPGDYYFAPSAAELAGIYTEIARRIHGGVITRTAVITDVVPSNMTYVPGSAVPPVVSYVDRVLRWEFSDVRGDLLMQYRLRPQQLGTWPTNVDARMRYRDGLDVEGELVFPVPYVEVVARPLPIYLPMTAKAYCRPTELHADVALIIDSSSSMTGDKFTEAQAAATSFVERLDLPRDQAAVVGFNRTPTLASGLTGDLASLRAAINGLEIVPGTVIDSGLRTATAELVGPRAETANSSVIVLLTDGQNN
ncbi:MAG: VWA domain-containing protein, partial [Anaerolineae bacterium]